MAEAQQTARSAHKPAALEFSFNESVFEPLHSGALYWRAKQTLLVADLHLEKLSSFASRGQFLPPYDTGMTLLRLETDIRTTGSQRVIALGDSFHRNEGVHTLLDQDRARLDRLTQIAEWVWLSGNHDAKPHGIGGHCRPSLREGNFSFHHEPRVGTAGQVSGHLHPAARVYINGRSARRRCFVFDQETLILPAYGASTGSLNILGPAFAGLFKLHDLKVLMLGRDRIYPVNPKRLAAG